MCAPLCWNRTQQQLLPQPQPQPLPLPQPQLLPQPFPQQQHRSTMMIMIHHRQEQSFPELKHISFTSLVFLCTIL